MRFIHWFIIPFFSALLFSGCGIFPIEVDCGYECEDNTVPVTHPNKHAIQPQNSMPPQEPVNPVQQQLEPKDEKYKQPVMFASNDWRQYAIELAEKINKELIQRNHVDKSVYVRPGCSEPDPCGTEDTAFNKAFRDFLITELVKLAVPTVDSPEENSVIITYQAQVVIHGKPFNPLQLINLGNKKHFVADEVVIITSILLDNRYIFRDSGVYTIKDKDFWHYQNHSKEAAIIQVAPKKETIPEFEADSSKVPNQNKQEPQPILQNS